MDLKQIIMEKQKRVLMTLAIKKVIALTDFTKSVRRGVIHKQVAELLNETVHNQLIIRIREELIRNKIVPTSTGTKRFYKHVDSCKNYAWLRYKHLKGDKPAVKPGT